jgi:hypothetical protein
MAVDWGEWTILDEARLSKDLRVEHQNALRRAFLELIADGLGVKRNLLEVPVFSGISICAFLWLIVRN